jgi:N-glycosylase/DNA lyase
MMERIRLLRKEHGEKKNTIRKRLSEFKQFQKDSVVWSYADERMRFLRSEASPSQRLFEELSFCILAANTSAEMGMKTVDRLRSMLPHATPLEMTSAIKGLYRFINLRPEYIVHSRTYLEQLEMPMDMLIGSFEDRHDLREFLANNTGIGYKEASHFLRNIGIGGFAILDKHIINSMHEFGVIGSNKAPSSGKEYLALEQKYLHWAKDLRIDCDELDLLLWSRKTGKILK